MASESARAASREEARFRIDAPNSRARAVKVIALDPASERVAERLARAIWSGASFLTANGAAPAREKRFSISGWLADLAGHTKNLVDEIDSADQVVMIASAGANLEAASIIGEACSLKRVMTTALIVAPAETPDAALSHSLAQLRPWVLMLVIASDEDYIADMLTALRA
ncbi:MAG TPA: hypothetical protein VG986_23020 [Pseudolabrys sp.]|nr:hypothetical protein [Pseudolabrys sp.]